MVARQALQALGDLAEVARQDGVARHVGLPRGIERPGGAGQVRGAADAAGARRHHQAGLRILVAQDDLEAAEQLGLRPGVDDDAVLDVDAHVEVAFDATDGRDIEGLHCAVAWGMLLSTVMAMAWRRDQTTKMSSSAQAGAAALAAAVSLT